MEPPPKNLFFYELCRLCLENEGVCDLFETNELVNDILSCTGVKVSVSDNLPRKICSKCSDVVKNWKELKIFACRNDVHLRTLFNYTNSDDSDGNETVEKSSIPSCETPCKLDSSINCNNQISSKQKLSMLLDEDEDEEMSTPVKRQTISMRKNLFPSSAEKLNKKLESPARNNENECDKLLRLKVKNESQCKKENSNGGDVMEYICDVCNKGFDKQKKLYLHQRLHNKKIYCPLDACGKKFATKGDLQKHLRTHTGEKPFKCSICDKGFTQRVSLKAHVTSVHDGKELKDDEGETVQRRSSRMSGLSGT